ncbi:hypothetical protein BALCAV_0203915 [Alkalihalobacillus alcalophilus ATCC 27647 = CGMCC 1.3604]|uniref:Uncharacterized protein n=1 Tax=Alkalihalobacillus alcalophilus ATCC 27647 = CGMCC 1.3604 TaxID=1218173 RepID=A0A094WL81_ALKAL|nr:hypothetical protein BALCAV_0203915 [Alkalihalobacillus alcalophilus ATCC 27647 = CGMCC 1.3604]
MTLLTLRVFVGLWFRKPLAMPGVQKSFKRGIKKTSLHGRIKLVSRPLHLTKEGGMPCEGHE